MYEQTDKIRMVATLVFKDSNGSKTTVYKPKIQNNKNGVNIHGKK